MVTGINILLIFTSDKIVNVINKSQSQFSDLQHCFNNRFSEKYFLNNLSKTKIKWLKVLKKINTFYVYVLGYIIYSCVIYSFGVYNKRVHQLLIFLYMHDKKLLIEVNVFILKMCPTLYCKFCFYRNPKE